MSNRPPNLSDPEEEIFTRSPKIIKYDMKDEKVQDKENQREDNGNLKGTVVVKSKKSNVPSNITCHCAGNSIL